VGRIGKPSASFSQVFSKQLQIFACFLQIFANISLAILSFFKRLRGRKPLIHSISKFFVALWLLRDRRGFRAKPETPQNETKTKRNRFAREILSIAKPLISLSPTKAEFRGFEPFQGLMRFAKRFFEFCGQNVLPQYLAGLPLSRR